MSRLKTRFTEKATEALGYSVLEARSLGSARIETEHLLLGIVNDPDSTASKLLTSFGVDTGNIRSLVISEPTDTKVDVELAFSDSSQEAITNAALQSYLW